MSLLLVSPVSLLARGTDRERGRDERQEKDKPDHRREGKDVWLCLSVYLPSPRAKGRDRGCNRRVPDVTLWPFVVERARDRGNSNRGVSRLFSSVPSGDVSGHLLFPFCFLSSLSFSRAEERRER